eukprot:3248333-Pyramimonas_sp.AAC.1
MCVARASFRALVSDWELLVRSMLSTSLPGAPQAWGQAPARLATAAFARAAWRLLLAAAAAARSRARASAAAAAALLEADRGSLQ